MGRWKVEGSRQARSRRRRGIGRGIQEVAAMPGSMVGDPYRGRRVRSEIPASA